MENGIKKHFKTSHEGSIPVQVFTINTPYRKSTRSRWLDISQVLFLHFYGPYRSRGPKKKAKRERVQNPAILTELAWSIKDL